MPSYGEKIQTEALPIFEVLSRSWLELKVA